MGPAARLLALAGVDDLEVVYVAVLLVEVAVAILIVAVPHVEGVEVALDLGARLAGGDLIPGPLVYGVPDEEPHRRADAAVGVVGLVVAVVVAVGVAVVGAVAGRVVGHLTHSVTSPSMV